MPCQYKWTQIGQLDKTLKSLHPHIGTPGVDELNKGLNKIRGEIMANMGFKVPRTITQMAVLTGLFKGKIGLWYDREGGFMTEGRLAPNLPPVYHYVNDDVALNIIMYKLSSSMANYLMTPDDYLGE